MESKRKRLAALFTFLFSAGIVVVLLFLFGFKTPLPLPEEEGVVIEVGGGGGGGGSDFSDAVEDYSSENANSGSLEENYMTDPHSESNYSSGQTSSGNNKTNTPEVDNRITNFKWGSGSGQGSGTGSGTGSGSGSGNGSGSGSGNGSGLGSGTGPGSGPGFSLNGRSAKSLPIPKYTEDDQGRVVVTVWVDKKGKVTRAEPGAIGTTISSPSLWNACKNSAMSSTFSVNDDAPEIQKGTITYFFVKQN